MRPFKVPTLGMTEFKASSKASRGLFGLSSNGVSKSTEPESTLKERKIIKLIMEEFQLLEFLKFFPLIQISFPFRNNSFDRKYL